MIDLIVLQLMQTAFRSSRPFATFDNSRGEQLDRRGELPSTKHNIAAPAAATTTAACGIRAARKHGGKWRITGQKEEGQTRADPDPNHWDPGARIG